MIIVSIISVVHHGCQYCCCRLLLFVQERRKYELQQAAEAEAANTARAALLRESVRKANHKILQEAQRLRAESRAQRESASRAVLDAQTAGAVRPSSAQSSGSGTASCASAPVILSQQGSSTEGCRDEVSSSRHEGFSTSLGADVAPRTRSLLQPLDMSGRRVTADDLLLRQRYGSPLPALLDAAMSKVPVPSASVLQSGDYFACNYFCNCF